MMRFLDCCADVDVSSISEEEQETFIKSVTDQAGHLVCAPDFRKDRQRALAKELLKPKYQVYGFKTGHIHKNLSGHFQTPAQIRYEMNKLRARGILVKSKYKSFYTVTKKGFTWLWLEICSDNFFKNPMISKSMKNDVLKFAAQPSQMEEAYDLIHRGLSQLTQQLAIKHDHEKTSIFLTFLKGKAYRYDPLFLCIQHEKTPVKWAFYRKEQHSKPVKLCRGSDPISRASLLKPKVYQNWFSTNSQIICSMSRNISWIRGVS